jgi:uncharacterized oxidoreductase
MPTLTYDALRDLAGRLVRAMGAPPDEVPIVADALARANLAGHDSHGVIRLEQYARMVREGGIVPGAPTTVVTEGPATALLDGNWNFGAVVATRAVQLAARKAREAGVATVTVRNANHLGRLGEYTLLAAEEGFAAIGCVNNHGRGTLVAPWGGSDGRLATNPLSIATPGPERPLLLDITTSVVAEGKVRLKRNAGVPCPEGWLVDHRGEPTTDPACLYGEPRGAILPFGGQVGHKGYGLAVMVDVLAGALSGAGCSRSPDARLGNAMFFTLVDVERFLPLAEFTTQVQVLADWLRASPPAPGFREILLPGEIEAREEERRRREGIEVDAETWRQLAATAEQLGVTV